jgi:hypothetical protein
MLFKDIHTSGKKTLKMLVVYFACSFGTLITEVMVFVFALVSAGIIFLLKPKKEDI